MNLEVEWVWDVTVFNLEQTKRTAGLLGPQPAVGIRCCSTSCVFPNIIWEQATAHASMQKYNRWVRKRNNEAHYMLIYWFGYASEWLIHNGRRCRQYLAQ